MGVPLKKEDAVDLTRLIAEYETKRKDTMYDGEGKDWIDWVIYRLYEHGFCICSDEKEIKGKVK